MAHRIKGRSKADRMKEVLQKTNGVCAHCGGKATTIDHVIPQSAGGGSDPKNLMPLCLKCNRDKASGDVVPQTYYKYASCFAMEELMDYIDYWKMMNTNAVGELFVDHYGIDEVGMAKYLSVQ